MNKYAVSLVAVILVIWAASRMLPPLTANDSAVKDNQNRGGEAAKPEPESTAGRAALERRFSETLSNSTLSGKWRLVKEGKLGEEREERYTISTVRKLAGDVWVINARIEYGDKDVTVPVPVKVKWAGDTPVITVTDVGIPGIGTYSARVLFYNGVYTGAWFGKGYGGFLSGVIEKERKEEKTSDEKAGK